jgi:hypothetical protein
MGVTDHVSGRRAVRGGAAAVLAVVACALAGWWLITVTRTVRAVHAGTVPAASPSPAARCHEDSACWDCRTMGNRVCGPASLPSARPVTE